MSLSSIQSPTDSHSSSSSEQYIRFSLEPDTNMMLPITGVTEVLKLSLKSIVPIPQMPSWAMGVYNWRGEILWMVDLGNLLGLYPWQEQNLNPSATTTMIIKADGGSRTKGTARKSLGLVIRNVEDIEWCDRDRLQQVPASAVNSTIASLVEGYWLDPQKKMVLALSSNAIIQRASQI